MSLGGLFVSCREFGSCSAISRPVPTRWNSTCSSSIIADKALLSSCRHTSLLNARIGPLAWIALLFATFIAKLHSTHQEVGVLVAANGVTGDTEDQTAANDIIREAFDRDDIKLIVLTRAEIEAFRSQRDIVLLLEQKYGTACLRSTTLT
jgi:hypothetical protein